MNIKNQRLVESYHPIVIIQYLFLSNLNYTAPNAVEMPAQFVGFHLLRPQTSERPRPAFTPGHGPLKEAP